MTTVEEIEFKYNLEYSDEIKNKYNDIIIKIFNHEDININNDPEIKIIKAHYYIANNASFKGEQLLLELAYENNLDGFYNLSLYYYINNEQEKSIEYLQIGADQNHIKSSVNLAYLYYMYKDYDNFNKYNKIGIDNNNQMALIHLGLYTWHVLQNEGDALALFNKVSSHHSFFTIAKLLNEKSSLKNRDMIIFNCIKALQLKIKKVYIDLLSEHTTTLQRYCLYKDNNINIKSEIKTFDNYCPICLQYTNLIELICKHSLCIECVKKTKFVNCSICNEFI
jgi:hypothetical protein